MATHSSNSCLENPMDGRAWWAVVHGATREESDMTERLHFHSSLSCTGEWKGNPLQCSCLENPRDDGDWWAAVYGVTHSRTRLKQLSRPYSTKRQNIIIMKRGSVYQSWTWGHALAQAQHSVHVSAGWTNAHLHLCPWGVTCRAYLTAMRTSGLSRKGHFRGVLPSCPLPTSHQHSTSVWRQESLKTEWAQQITHSSPLPEDTFFTGYFNGHSFGIYFIFRSDWT